MRTRKGEKAKPNSKYEHYFAYQRARVRAAQAENSHRYLAIRRGWMEEELTLSIGGRCPPATTRLAQSAARAAGRGFEGAACRRSSVVVPGRAAAQARGAPGAARVRPARIENEVHKALHEIADEAAITVFAENVRKLLLASPFGPKAVLGVDPGIRTGCKLAVVDDSGKYLASTVMHLRVAGRQGKRRASARRRGQERRASRAIAVGNGTAGRETESFVRDGARRRSASSEVPVVMVSEAGASVYSASDVAREEFPDLDLTVRGAISIARRLQDPLAELVKIDPKSIGVGQYQHDVSPSAAQEEPRRRRRLAA